MTAEIAIFNKGAIALAADSAVTIQTPSGQKIYNTVNKLFTLSKYQPVGVMVYGNSEFMGVPWESIIKEHRRELGKTKFGTIKEYVTNFVTWLEKAKLLFPEDQQSRVLDGTIRNYFGRIKEDINKRIAAKIAKDGSIDEASIKKFAEDVISHHHRFWNSKATLPSFEGGFFDNFKTKHGDAVKSVIISIFEKLPISDEFKGFLTEIAALIFSTDHFSDSHTGIVIAGFGEDEIFPALVSCSFESILDDKLKWKEQEAAQITFQNPAWIIPFAQREIVDTFLSGIDPNLRRILIGAMTKCLQGYGEQIFKAIPDSTMPNKKQMWESLTKSTPELLRNLNNAVDTYARNQHILPIMNAVGALPKDELASMAESLVNLTSFRRRISMDAETVGGQIDVAVISKGDGFIWIKRKHYFEPGKNPQYMVNCYSERST